ncbi:Transposon protein [Phytophthora megakarya]|uniref:Transposon protein n=1 Tax=Phytophthora megakarya TaxID=4795 RepID=A0A225VX12_9STRA|nr:Transposon protein [Phytophthora megakarya]
MSYLSCKSLATVMLSSRRRRRKKSKSKKRRSANLVRDHVWAYKRFWKYYLSNKATYTDEQFRRRFRMNKVLFLSLVNALGDTDIYFSWRKDCTESTMLESLDQFVSSVIRLYSTYYLRLPTEHDLSKILEFNAARVVLENCPSAWRGAFQDASRDATVVLEAMATYDLRLWHAFVGMPGSNNDLIFWTRRL